jgi:hypothetical protein
LRALKPANELGGARPGERTVGVFLEELVDQVVEAVGQWSGSLYWSRQPHPVVINAALQQGGCDFIDGRHEVEVSSQPGSRSSSTSRQRGPLGRTKSSMTAIVRKEGAAVRLFTRVAGPAPLGPDS